MTKPTKPQLSEDMERKFEKLQKSQCRLGTQKAEVSKTFLATAIEDTRKEYVRKVEEYIVETCPISIKNRSACVMGILSYLKEMKEESK